jgi:hypothetical protein
MMNIKLIRLQTGEDLIADVVKEDAALTLENPCMVYVRPQGNSASVGITRWLPYADTKQFTIDNKWIVVVTDPVEDLKNEYNKVFGSGLIVPPTQIAIADK